MTDYIPNPANYIMKGNAPKAQETPPPALDLTSLEQMTREELIKLVRLCNAVVVGYALQTKEEKREALRLKVYAIAMGSGQDAVTLKAANDWLDREEGKATQRIIQDTTVSYDLKANSALLNRFAEKLGSKHPIVIEGTTGSGADSNP